MAKQMLYTPAQLRAATPEQRRQMQREITERNLRDNVELYARLAPFDGAAHCSTPTAPCKKTAAHSQNEQPYIYLLPRRTKSIG